MIKTSDLIWQDTQHQVLFRLLDDMRQEIFDTLIIDQLRLYADHHFCLEEAYMETLKYPGMQLHIKAHNRFREELNQLAKMPEQMNHQLRISLSQFLEEWLKRHVFGIDKEFEQFVLDSQHK